MHLLPLLALLEAGAGKEAGAHFPQVNFPEQPNEYEFWRRYFSLPGDPERPFFNPLTLRLAEANYPHSNSATIRKNTFRLKWNAAQLESRDGSEFWTLADNYAETFEEKVLSKGGEIQRIPALDLSILLFRNEEFADGASSENLIQQFRERFPQRDADFTRIFKFNTESPEQIFSPASEVSFEEYDEFITAVLLGEETTPPPPPPAGILPADDAILNQVQKLLQFGSSGIIFEGPPGTGKSWYAKRVAEVLVRDSKSDIFETQFHPSFGYEDFVEGYRPDEGKVSGYSIVKQLFLKVCERARSIAPNTVVLIVDEITRGDPSRIFGELLTYLERGYRGVKFILPFTGDSTEVPHNVVILGTMNPHDHSVAHVDAAFVRRFDFIQVPPSAEAVEEFLQGGDLSDSQISEIRKWFVTSQDLLAPLGLGHTFFKDVRSISDLELVWDYRIKRYGESVQEFDPIKRKGFLESFPALLERLRTIEAGSLR